MEFDIDERLKKAEESKARRAEEMPAEEDALKVLNQAYLRLKELGWQEEIYCPKDGTHFSAIEIGSTDIHDCNYSGEWPTGSWWLYDGDIWPARPILWRKRLDSDPVVNHGTIMSQGSCKCATCASSEGGASNI